MTSTLPFISIVVPARNAGKTISKTLASIQQNGYPREKLEVIVVNDASSDDTKSRAESFGAQVVTTEGGNRSRARNAGALRSKGELIAFIDADCVVAPDWLLVLSGLFSNEQVGGAQAQIFLHLSPDLDLNNARSWKEGPLKPVPLPVGNGLMPCLATGGCMYRRSVFLECGLFDESLMEMEDLDLTWKILLSGYIPYFTSATACFELKPPSGLTPLARYFAKGRSWRHFQLKWWKQVDSGPIVHGDIENVAHRIAFYLGILAGRCSKDHTGSKDDLALLVKKGNSRAYYFSNEAGRLRTVPSLRFALSDHGLTLLNLPFALWDVGEIESRVFQQLISGCHSEEEITAPILEEYDTDKEEVQLDVRRFMEQLCDSGLLIFENIDFRQCYPCSHVEALIYES